jgi:PadR family transcriptional regulator
MGGPVMLGELEQMVLLAVVRMGDRAYAVSVRDELRRQAGVKLTRGTIYVTLDRLERKGYLKSSLSDPTPERGGKAKRCFKLTAAAVRGLRYAHGTMSRLRAGIEPLIS